MWHNAFVDLCFLKGMVMLDDVAELVIEGKIMWVVVLEMGMLDYL